MVGAVCAEALYGYKTGEPSSAHCIQADIMSSMRQVIPRYTLELFLTVRAPDYTRSGFTYLIVFTCLNIVCSRSSLFGTNTSFTKNVGVPCTPQRWPDDTSRRTLSTPVPAWRSSLKCGTSSPAIAA